MMMNVRIDYHKVITHLRIWGFFKLAPNKRVNGVPIVLHCIPENGPQVTEYKYRTCEGQQFRQLHFNQVNIRICQE